MKPYVCSAKITRVQVVQRPEYSSGEEDNDEGEGVIEDSQILEDLPSDTEVRRHFPARVHKAPNADPTPSRTSNSYMLA